jgi:hypothetical protein
MADHGAVVNKVSDKEAIKCGAPVDFYWRKPHIALQYNQEAAMADPANGTEVKTRDRSPSFPFIPLKTAVERLEAFEKKFSRHPTPAAKAGLAWGLREKSSQADQTLAALKSFGLVKYEGMGPARQVSLTLEGRNYLRALQDSIKRQILKQCALRPRIIRKFWAIWQDDRPPDEVALDSLVMEHRFSDGGARSFLRVYDDTISFAGLSVSDKIEPDLRENDDDPEDGDPQPPPPPPAPGKVKLMEGERIVFTEESTPLQYVKLVASGVVDESLLDAIEDYVKRQKKRLAHKGSIPDYKDPEYLERRRLETIRRVNATDEDKDEAAN